MATSLSTYTSNRNNNFNLIRFLAASLVIYSHSFAIALGSGDTEPLKTLVGFTFGTFAVDVFFVSSGFLITSSYLARNNLVAFAWARALRIYPALIVAMLICVFGVGLAFTELESLAYLTDKHTYWYLLRNITLITGVEHHLPGVFEQQPFPKAVNGSIWTLPYEIKMYILVAVALLVTSALNSRVKWLTFKSSLLVLAVLSTALTFYDHFVGIGAAKNNFVHLFAMFFIGASYFVWKDKVMLSSKLAGIASIVLAVSAFNKELFIVSYFITVPYLVLFLAYVPKGAILKFNNFGDYSYGIYIYAFPVQQMLVYFFPEIGVPIMTIATFLVVLGLASLSWHLVEKPTLKMKNGYVVIERYIQQVSNKKSASA